MFGYTVKELRHSIIFYLLKIVFSIYLLITLVLTLLHMGAEYVNVKEIIRAEIKSIVEIFGPGLSKELWNFNLDFINSLGAGLLKNPMIVGIEISQSDQNRVAWDWQGGVVLDKTGRVILVPHQRKQQT